MTTINKSLASQISTLPHPASGRPITHGLDTAGRSLSALVNQTLDFFDWRIVNRPDCFAAAGAFDGESKSHGFVTDVEFVLAHGAIRLGSYIVEFVRHANSIAEG
jgi:hypothetical protein